MGYGTVVACGVSVTKTEEEEGLEDGLPRWQRDAVEDVYCIAAV